MNLSLKDRLKNCELECDEKKPKKDLYEICKQFSDVISGPLSKKTKDELYEIVSQLNSYKKNLITANYKIFTFSSVPIVLDDEQHEIVTEKL